MAPKEESDSLLSNASSPPQITSDKTLKNRVYDGTFNQNSLASDHTTADNTTANNNNEDESSSSSFFAFFINSSGPPQVMFLSMIFAISIGSTIGVVPAVMTTQYAHIRHGLDIDLNCSGSDKEIPACLDGNSDALTAASVTSFVSNMIVFFTASLVGSISDEVGRRPVLLVAQVLGFLHPFFLVLLQLFPMMNPAWYYAVNAGSNLVSWTTISLSAISDVVPQRFRASCFGFLFCGFYLGFAISPALAVPLSHLGVSLLSATGLAGSILYSLFFLPETLSKQTSDATRKLREIAEAEAVVSVLKDDDILVSHKDGDNLKSPNMFLHSGRRQKIKLTRLLLRPFRELLILNRNTLFRLLSVLAFFSGMSTSGDQTLLIYYAEGQLGFNEVDVAYLIFIIGVLGIIVQGFLLNTLIYWLGERMVVVVAFFFGIIDNSVYAFASDKRGIYVGATIGCMTSMSFPTISAIKANNVDEQEQGQIQGALYALSSLASAVGPAILSLVYRKTRNTAHPGVFFLLAAVFFFVATVSAIALPKDKSNSNKPSELVNDVDNDGSPNADENCDYSICNNNSDGGDGSDDINASPILPTVV